MRDLADILILRGVLSLAQVEEALQGQALYGGAFETNLMEVTGLTEQQIQPLLERAHQIHNRIDIFDLPSEDATRLLRHQQADRYRAVPFRLVGRVLDLLVHDPSAIGTIDDIAFATGCRVVLNVATEARVAWHLKRAYGIGLPTRLAQLLVRRPAAATIAPVETAVTDELAPPTSVSPRAETPISVASSSSAPAVDHGGVSVFPHGERIVDAPEPGPAPARAPDPAPAEARRPPRPSGEYSIVRESGPLPSVRQARPSQPPPLTARESIELPPPARRTASPSTTPPLGQPSSGTAAPSSPPSGLSSSSPPASPASAPPPPASTPPPHSPVPVLLEAPATPDPSASRSAEYQGAVWMGTESLDAAFARVESRDEIPAVMFGYLGARLERMLLFTARAGTLTGWDGRGPRIRRESVEAVVLSLTEPSVLQGACEHGLPFLGALPFGDVEESLLVRLGGVWPQHVVLWPIRVRERTVALFYGEAVSSEDLRTAREQAAQAVACVEKAFLRLILNRKRADS